MENYQNVNNNDKFDNTKRNKFFNKPKKFKNPTKDFDNENINQKSRFSEKIMAKNRNFLEHYNPNKNFLHRNCL